MSNKMKTNRSMRKRIKRTGRGKLLRHQSKSLGGKTGRRRHTLRRTRRVKTNREKVVSVLIGLD